jgi:hypothetical protein
METLGTLANELDYRAEPVNWRHTLELWTFGLAKVPLILYVRPRVRVVTSDRYEISIGLTRRTGNQVGSMYFGAIVMGAEMTPSAHALVVARSMGKLASFVTKQVKAEFLAAAKGDVIFRTENGAEIRAALERAVASNAAAVAKVNVVAFCADRVQKPVARFELELSVKAVADVKPVALPAYKRS